jgi:hypothetical protein
MLLRRCAVVALVVAAGALAARSDDPKGPLPDGSYLLSYSSSPAVEQRLAILKVETKDGKPTAEVTDAGPRKGVKVSDLKVDGKHLTMNLELGAIKLKFEGTCDPADPKRVLGTLSDDTRTFRASLAATDKEKLERGDMVSAAKMPEEMTQAQQLRIAPQMLKAKARQTKDAEAKEKLTKEAEAAQKEADEKVPGLYKAVVQKHADGPAAVVAAEALLGMAGKLGAKPDEVEGWAKLVEADAKRYGPRIEQTAVADLARALAGQDGYGPIALKYAERAAAGEMPTARKSAALKVLAAAQEKAGKTDLAVKTRAEVEKLEAVLDEEYHKTVPPFKPQKFAGRKEKDANRAAVMELFTGAQCPPCVAADVAFDGLMKTYAPADVVLLQYHMHIPGPDPLTNPDTIARWDYYTGKFPGEMGGVPSSLFNGKPRSGGGGPMANGERKYDEYRGILDELLEKSADLKLAGSASLAGDKVTATVEVTGMKEPKDKVKLRLVLVEESIRYVGGNGIRFHHQVVRSLFGQPDGVAVKDLKDGKHTAAVGLEELRTKLKTYLTEFNKEREFPNPDRPLALKGLKVVALVQDDETGEILQAAQFDVGG